MATVVVNVIVWVAYALVLLVAVLEEMCRKGKAEREAEQVAFEFFKTWYEEIKVHKETMYRRSTSPARG